MEEDIPEVGRELLQQHRDEEGRKQRRTGECILQSSSQVLARDAMHIVGRRAEADGEVACNHIKELLFVGIQAVLSCWHLKSTSDTTEALSLLLLAAAMRGSAFVCKLWAKISDST